jgi:lipopolysaccharide biosynthesis regulator YciM
MKVGKIIAIVIAVGVVAAVYLADRTPAETPQTEEVTEQQTEQPTEAESSMSDADLDAKVDEAVEIIQSQSQPPMVAIQLLREVIAADSNHIGANYWLGEFSVMSGQYDRAIPRYRNILRQQPANVDVCIKLARAYAATGQLEMGTAVINKFIASNPSEETNEQLQIALNEMNVES